MGLKTNLGGIGGSANGKTNPGPGQYSLTDGHTKTGFSFGVKTGSVLDNSKNAG
jgi:hypothetical protein